MGSSGNIASFSLSFPRSPVLGRAARSLYVAFWERMVH